MKNLLVIVMLSVVLLCGCSDNGNSEITSDTTASASSNKNVEYFDTDAINESSDANDEIAVAWAKNGIIRCEVKVFMDTVHWQSDNDSSATMSNRTDLDGDGEDEHIEILSDPDTGEMSVCITMNEKTINLFGVVSQVFLDAVRQMPGGDDASNMPIYIDAACIDLDGDNKREIILAVGNDNGSLVVSILRYTGGNLLYEEAGGIKGTQNLRYVIVTTRNTIFAELYFTNPPSFDPEDMNYVEYEYDGNELKQIGYRLIRG